MGEHEEGRGIKLMINLYFKRKDGGALLKVAVNYWSTLTCNYTFICYNKS